MQVSSLTDNGVAAAVSRLSVQSTRATELRVTTDEGDRVTISTSSTRALSYAAASGVAGGTRASAESMTASGSDSLSIIVEGALSRDELVDLRKVIKAFERAAVKGDAERLLHRLSRPDLDTIESVSARVTSETAISTSDARVQSEVLAPAAPAPLPPPPQDQGPQSSATSPEAEARQPVIGDFLFALLASILTPEDSRQ